MYKRQVSLLEKFGAAQSVEKKPDPAKPKLERKVSKPTGLPKGEYFIDRVKIIQIHDTAVIRVSIDGVKDFMLAHESKGLVDGEEIELNLLHDFGYTFQYATVDGSARTARMAIPVKLQKGNLAEKSYTKTSKELVEVYSRVPLEVDRQRVRAIIVLALSGAERAKILSIIGTLKDGGGVSRDDVVFAGPVLQTFSREDMDDEFQSRD